MMAVAYIEVRENKLQLNAHVHFKWFAVSGGYNVFLNNRRSSEHLFGSDQFDSATGGFFFNSGGETAFAEKIIILFRDLCQNA